jgi:hypothetical protein
MVRESARRVRRVIPFYATFKKISRRWRKTLTPSARGKRVRMKSRSPSIYHTSSKSLK